MAERVRIHIEDAPVKDILLPEGMERELVVKLLQKCNSLKMVGLKIFGCECTLLESKVRVWEWFCKVECRYDMNYWMNTYLAYAIPQTPMLVRKDCMEETEDKLKEALDRLRLAEGRLTEIIGILEESRAAAQGKEDINQQNL